MRLRLVASAALLVVACSHSYRYVSATVDADGAVNILTSDGVTVRPPVATGQAGAADPAVSSDQRAVGWLALFPNTGTTYPIPLSLVVLSPSGSHEIKTGQMIDAWAFVDSSASVAFEAGPVHGDATSYELHDVSNGKLLETYDAKRDGPIEPAWVRSVEAAHK